MTDIRANRSKMMKLAHVSEIIECRMLKKDDFGI